MKKTSFTALAIAVSAVLAGCASDVKLDDKASGAPVESRNTTGGSGASTGSGATGGVASVDLTKNASSAELGRVVYFDYDSFVIKDEFRSVVESQAKALSTDRAKKLSVEGHTDERGGSEYNLALGQAG